MSASVNETEVLWLMECPVGNDQGLVRPLVTESGRVVLFCDGGNEYWIDPGQLPYGELVVPCGPDWQLADSVHVTPGTTRLADVDDLPAEWQEMDWRRL